MSTEGSNRPRAASRLVGQSWEAVRARVDGVMIAVVVLVLLLLGLFTSELWLPHPQW